MTSTPFISSTGFANIRTAILGLTGVICVTYAALALLQGRPDPMSPWIPGVAGFGAMMIIWISAEFAGRANTRQASDELFASEWRRAVRVGYWVALWLYPAFAILLVLQLTAYPTAFAAMGTMSGAASLLTFVYLTLRSQ